MMEYCLPESPTAESCKLVVVEVGFDETALFFIPHQQIEHACDEGDEDGWEEKQESVAPLLQGVVKVVGHAQPFQVKVIEGEYQQVAGAVEGVGEGYHGVEVGKKDGMTKIEECGCGHESQQPHP